MECLATSPSCSPHKHLQCDGHEDCRDGSDETNAACQVIKTFCSFAKLLSHLYITDCLAESPQDMTVSRCYRRGGTGEHLHIPLSWLTDGVEDCLDGVDEKGVWPTCGSNTTLRYVSEDGADRCENVFICTSGRASFIEFHHLCDGVDTCGNENNICQTSHGKSTVHTRAMTSRGLQEKVLFHCLKGLQNVGALHYVCIKEQFSFPNHEIIGVHTQTDILLPDTTFNCDYTYGEVYIYLSCSGRCYDSICPLTEPLQYDSCTGQFPDRVYSLANNEYLTFAVASHDTYQNAFFKCGNISKCVDYSRVCDLVDDCGDQSDEVMCSNHFQCNATGRPLKDIICTKCFYR